MDDFEGFVRANWDRLHAAVSHTARRYRQEPDDALQEALLRAYANRAAFESEQHAVNWICRVAHDLLCDQRRSWYDRRVSASADLPENACGAAPDPADLLVRKDSGRAVLRALRALPPAHRLLLWQHAVDGRSYADIARETSRPLATVRSVALRARQAARGHLAGESFGIGAALSLRLRVWWSRGLTPTTPTTAAAILALGLVAGGPGGTAPGTTPLPPGARSVATWTAARAPDPAPAAPGAHRSSPRQQAAAAGAVAAPDRSPPTAPAAPPFTVVAFNGDGWGSCEIDDGSASSLTSTGTWECDIEGESVTCTTVPTALPCSLTLRGNVVGVTDRQYRCTNDVTRGGELVLRVDGHPPIVIPLEFRANDGEIHVWDEAIRDLGPYAVNGRMTFVCAHGSIRRAPVLSGHIKPR